MEKSLVITDLTHMSEDMVCTAGVDRNGTCIRPVAEGGVRLHNLYYHGELVVHPRALVSFDLSPAETEPPHTEDALADFSTATRKEVCNDSQWEEILSRISLLAVADVFDGHLEEGRRVQPGAPTRSLGTVEGARIERIHVDDTWDRRQYRADFVDGAGVRYEGWPVNDLAFRHMMQASIAELGDERAAAYHAKRLLAQSSDRLFLRIGLARPNQVGNHPLACWTQITGIHTIPDYLDGKTFADF